MTRAPLSILALTLVASAAPGPQEHHARMSVFLDVAQFQPGQTAHLGVHFAIDKGWHIYWDGLNDTGFPPSIDLTLPEGYQAGEPLWPAPKRYIAPGDILDHIYEGEATIIVPIHVPASAKPGELATIVVNSSWLVCNEACIPEKGQAKIGVGVGELGKEPPAPANAPRFASARARIPIPLDQTKHPVKASVRADRLVITATDAARLAFFPGTECVPLIDPVRHAAANSPSLSIPLAQAGGRVQGVIEVVGKDSPEPRWYQIDLPPRAAR